MVLSESKNSEILPHLSSEGLPDFEDSFYFNARWYDPGTGRFMTEDPVKDGLLWYAYCNNNPLKFVDPSGLISDSAALVAALEERDLEKEAEEAEEIVNNKNYMAALRNSSTFQLDPDSFKDEFLESYGLSEEQFRNYQDFISNLDPAKAPKYPDDYHDKNKQGKQYDCADYGLWAHAKGIEHVTGQPFSETVEAMSRNGKPLDNFFNISASDFFNENGNLKKFDGNVSGIWDSPMLQVGMMVIFAPVGDNRSYTGHIGIISSVTKDINGKNTSIGILEGHSSEAAEITPVIRSGVYSENLGSNPDYLGLIGIGFPVF